MKNYDSIYYVSSNHPFLDEMDEYSPVNLGPLCRASQKADMLPLSPKDILAHPLGVVAVGTYSTRGHFELADALSYAGITGFSEIDGDKMAVIGGVITKPSARQLGLAYHTIKEVLTVGSMPATIMNHDHQGYMARCNNASIGIFQELGFDAVDSEGGRTIMAKGH